ncbi:MAG: hypothetical protein CL935_03435 [Deltaproteobacteria bacterium]|nr:hypothetical protein [Deltaproteobacteria bacterium]
MLRRKILISQFFFLFCGLYNCNLLYASTESISAELIELKRQGWKVTETKSSIESRPGIKPYQNVKREVQVVKYKLKKGIEVLFCVVEYDSQKDTIQELCAETLKDAEKKLSR